MRHPVGTTPLPGGDPCMRMYEMHLFCETHFFSSGNAYFLALSATGHAGGPPVHWTQAWVPDGLRGACSGRSKPRNLTSNHEVDFRRARTEQDNEKTTSRLFCSTPVKALYLVAATAYNNSSRTLCLCGPIRRSVGGDCVSVSVLCVL